jgi:hypothetical protein
MSNPPKTSMIVVNGVLVSSFDDQGKLPPELQAVSDRFHELRYQYRDGTITEVEFSKSLAANVAVIGHTSWTIGAGTGTWYARDVEEDLEAIWRAERPPRLTQAQDNGRAEGLLAAADEIAIQETIAAEKAKQENNNFGAQEVAAINSANTTEHSGTNIDDELNAYFEVATKAEFTQIDETAAAVGGEGRKMIYEGEIAELKNEATQNPERIFIEENPKVPVFDDSWRNGTDKEPGVEAADGLSLFDEE